MSARIEMLDAREGGAFCFVLTYTDPHHLAAGKTSERSDVARGRYLFTKAREQLAKLLDAFEAGEEVVILRRGRPVARVVPIAGSMTPFVDRSALRDEIPPMTVSSEQIVRDLRNRERF